jgi:predicted transcriptional regulator
MMKRDVAVYVRGEITNPDHKTVHLEGWRRLFMNTENRSMATRFLAFLD